MRTVVICFMALLPAFAAAAEGVIEVRDVDALRRALAAAGPGSQIRIAPGKYPPGVFASGLRGTAERPIVIEGADPQQPPIFEGGATGWQLSDCAHLTLRHIAVSGQSGNGINIDDGGSYDTPTHHIVLESLHVSRIGPTGNRDGIKLSGVDDFEIRRCTIDGWAGQAIDMVGCHRGLIENCRFVGREGFSQTTGPQTKGGSSQVVIRRCVFQNAGQRAVNLGGSTGMAYFRPPGAKYEARDITVEGCVFSGSQAPIAFVGVDGATVRYNTIYRPSRWVMRILQETTEPGFPPSRNGRFERNLVVFRAAELADTINIGPNTDPGSFRFAENLWYCEDRPQSSRRNLPSPETGGLHGIDPRLEDPANDLFRPRNPQAAPFGAHALPSIDP
ncbi:MAG: right-handed parallel beta-helix repeat-containing protein [Pirellulaceae bacterium]|nr:right-handed parallel beta-helix repeat-containing protein [Pirellulaceae bacterium]